MLVSLYTSRVVLNTLGVSDFGVYNVVGGLVAMFSILSGSLTTAISRYITFTLGKGDRKRLNEVFSTALIVQSIMAISIIILAEILGVWLLNCKMNIPETRMSAANWVLQFSIFSFAINLISIPYNSSIIAHEKMSAFAYISIVEASLKLLIIYLLVISNFDKLISYSFLLLCVAIVIRMTYGIYCKRHFEECHFKYIWDKKLLKEMTSFAEWSLIGNSAGILRNQGVNILLNIYCGTIVNAANGIATQVNNAIAGFSNNFIMAVNPQIIKLYSQKQLDKSYKLVMNSSRLSFMLMLLITTPVIFTTPEILKLWLKIVPDYSVHFIRLILLLSLVECICIPLVTLNQATGNIRNYQLVVGTIHLLNFPVSWVFLEVGCIPELVYVIAIVLAVVNLYARLIMLNRMLGVSIRSFNKNVVFKIFKTALLTYICVYGMRRMFDNWILIVILSTALTGFIISLTGISKNERAFILSRLHIIGK